MSTRDQEIRDRLRTIVAEVAELEDSTEVTDDSDLRSDLGINSMRGLEIMLLVEEELEVAVAEEALYEIQSFGDIVRYVCERLDAMAASATAPRS